MIQSGVFEDVGRASMRLEGGRPRLRYGVLYHLANRTLSFHGIADDAV